MVCPCQSDWDIRCQCEPYCPNKNTKEQFSNCPYAVENSVWHIENVSFEELPDNLRNYHLMTRSEFVNIIKPILEEWFRFCEKNKRGKINKVIDILLNDREREYAD